MRTAMITTFAFLLAGGSAWAQSSHDERGRSDRGGDSYRSQGYDSDRSSRYDRSRDNEQYAGRHQDDDKHHHSQSNGAHFHLKSGDHEFRVHCSGDDSTRDCVDAALTMFREVMETTSGSRTQGSTLAPSGRSGSLTPGAAGSDARTGESTTGR
jgi:hypothetical protein